jgi:LRR receptor-like serine/threonine-protein kinase FLS2
MSSLTHLELEQNNLSGIIPSNTGYYLPNLQQLHLNNNNFVGNIPKGIFNASNLIILQLNDNAFSGTLPHNDFGNLRFLTYFFINYNYLTIDDSFQFFTSLSNCKYLKFLDLSWNHILPNLPKSIGNISSQYFGASSCGIDGSIPQEVGNMSNVQLLFLDGNNLNEQIPNTLKGLHTLQ